MMLHVVYGYTQDSLDSKKIAISISETTLKVDNKDLKDITVHVKNSDTQPFKGYLYLHSAKGAKVATKDSVPVNLQAGQEIYVPSKIYVNQGTQEGNIYVGIALRTPNQITIDTITLKLILAPSRLLTASIDNEDMVLPRVGSYLNIPIRINNRGNVTEGGIIVIAFPSVLKDKTNRSIYFRLEPFKDTVIVFQRKVSRNMSKLGYMNVTINGIYDDGNIFATNLITFQDLSSKRSFDQNLNENSMHNNVISLGVQNAFDAGETYNIRARGFYDIKDGTVGYNFNLMKYKEGVKTLTINGTNLDLTYKRVGMRVGNITQGGEISFAGTGAEVFAYADSAHHNKVVAGYMDKSVNIYSSDGQTSYGRSAWAGYKYEKQTLTSFTSFTHDVDEAANINNDLVVSNLSWKSSEHFSADAKAAVANSTSTIGNNLSYKSMSGAFNYYAYFFKKLNLTGNNSYATAYYPGTRRGTLYLNEAAFLRLDKSTISTSVVYSNASPKYLNQANLINSENTNTTLDLTYGLTMGAFGFSLTPEYYTERGNWFYNNVIQEGTMTAERMSALITFNPVKMQQNLFLKTDVGLYKTGFSNEKKMQFRSMLSYSYRSFRLTGNLQQGNFYLGEAFQEHFATYNSFRLNIAPSMTAFLFNRALRVDGGIAYNKDYYSKSFLMNFNLLFNLGPMAFYSNVQYNIYGNSHYYRNIQFGVNYYLPESQPGKNINKGKIELFLFYDLNMNGNYDKGDSLASGIVVHIGKAIMMSGGDGKLTYNKLPPGNYSVFMPTQNGWYGHDLFIPLKEKESKSFYIALSQTGTVHGNINYQFDSTYSISMTKDKAWQSIVATNKDGQRFETKTDENGDYNLYLPVGTYTINVENLPNQVELLLKNNNVQPLQVESGKIINGVDFILKVKQRKVEIKKFGKQK
ncbi:carboxypeptidase regulatory-like domain-containing protein [Taibaiella lutea]|uniref:Carboxypeptidase regulatory-like domain-containing protein n=1 Tax=Taibaiella lutea TaxID=2608001 RepID=A0A5M6CH89_9BACT|nr:carboxypeptidase regulatory-like domain-containing protein [Taibaiella lutea]KAA5532499.1 carboxypeptidase regulatory-like domain-containing protein [Taibaiella lutea]